MLVSLDNSHTLLKQLGRAGSGTQLATGPDVANSLVNVVNARLKTDLSHLTMAQLGTMWIYCHLPPLLSRTTVEARPSLPMKLGLMNINVTNYFTKICMALQMHSAGEHRPKAAEVYYVAQCPMLKMAQKTVQQAEADALLNTVEHANGSRRWAELFLTAASAHLCHPPA